MLKSSIGLLLLNLLIAMPVWSRALIPDAPADLGSALQDERHAEAFYSAVLAKFGGARPFSNIIEAERQHEAMLIDLYATYGVAVPENGYAPAAPDTLLDACKIGVEAEIANRDLYVAAYSDITLVMQLTI